MSRRSPRLAVVAANNRRRHRYRRYRAIGQLISLAVLAAVPLAHVAAFDLWRGDHWWLGEHVTGLAAVTGFTAAIAVFYATTFVINAIAGRAFCGWACPVGQISRLSDAAQAVRPAGRRRARVQLAAFALLVAAVGALWFVSPRVLSAGSARAVAAAFAGVAGAAGLLLLLGWWWRWGFCRTACPIGLYYTAVQSAGAVAVCFEDGLGKCNDCGACAVVCPVELDPRRLDEPIPGAGALSVDGMPGFHHCLHCGACVEVCERVTRSAPRTAPLVFARHAVPDSVAELEPQPPEPEPVYEPPPSVSAAPGGGDAEAAPIGLYLLIPTSLVLLVVLIVLASR